MYGKSNMETYITIWKLDSQREFAVWLRKLKQRLCINLEGWDGEGGGREVQKGGDICISSVQSLSHVQLFATPWITVRQASLSITNSWCLLKLSCPSSRWCHPAISTCGWFMLRFDRKQQNSVKQLPFN